ncbi:ABC transporter ATP-binding protein, partial [bacterium]|nr:ABC transporter ATP-binding protein [bacterium]
MIHFTDISKQYGSHVLYKNASFQVRPGDKIGLVGPNGAGKSTLFRLIVGEEVIDSGAINIADKLVIGYFSQDVGEMKNRTALEEVKAGAGKVSELAQKLELYEKQLEDSAV